MVFSNSTSKTGIVEDIDFLLNTDSVSFLIAQKTRLINSRLDDVVSLILGSDGRWEWDDTNNTDLPIGTITLVNEQQDYSLSGGTLLNVTRVEVKDINGDYYLLTPLSQRDITSQALSEFQKTAGRPIFYDKLGDSIFLYPKPSTTYVTAAAGLKVYYQRIPSYFLVTDTTKTPGFSPLFHRILSIGAALDYCYANELINKINILTPLFQKMEQGLVSFYAGRSRDESVSMSLRKENWGGDEREVKSDKTAF